MGVPIRTTVGRPRAFRYPYENVSELAPRGLFNNPAFATDETFTSAYLERLEAHRDIIVSKLTELHDKYDGRPLVLLCYENVWKGDRCHRTTAAGWFNDTFGLTVPEISPSISRPRPV